MTISPMNYNLVIYQGATFRQNFIWQDSEQEPVDLTGYTARMMVRTSVGSDDPFITLTTENGGITLGGVTGSIALYMSATDTEMLTEILGCYDLELVAPSGGDTTRFLQGIITISREVTR